MRECVGYREEDNRDRILQCETGCRYPEQRHPCSQDVMSQTSRCPYLPASGAPRAIARSYQLILPTDTSPTSPKKEKRIKNGQDEI